MRLVTNFATGALPALQWEAHLAGAELRSLVELEDLDALRAYAPRGALVFVYGFPESAERSIDLLQGAGVPVAVWQVDDPQFFRSEKLHATTIRIARKAELSYSHTLELADEYARLGVQVRYLATGGETRPDMRPLEPPPEDELELDYAFVGGISPARARFLDELTRLLPGTLKGRVFTSVEPEACAHVYRHTRVNLAYGSLSDFGDAKSWGLTQRSWQVPLVGGFLLQDDRRHLTDHFQLGVDAESFTDVRECAEKIVHFCREPERRRAIAVAAQRRVWEGNLLAHRIEQVTADLAAFASAPPLSSAAHP